MPKMIRRCLTARDTSTSGYTPSQKPWKSCGAPVTNSARTAAELPSCKAGATVGLDARIIFGAGSGDLNNKRGNVVNRAAIRAAFLQSQAPRRVSQWIEDLRLARDQRTDEFRGGRAHAHAQHPVAGREQQIVPALHRPDQGHLAHAHRAPAPPFLAQFV